MAQGGGEWVGQDRGNERVSTKQKRMAICPLTGFHPVWYQTLQKKLSLVLILRIHRITLIPTWKICRWRKFPNSGRDDSLQHK
jgi:hypothetical protein